MRHRPTPAPTPIPEMVATLATLTSERAVLDYLSAVRRGRVRTSPTHYTPRASFWLSVARGAVVFPTPVLRALVTRADAVAALHRNRAATTSVDVALRTLDAVAWAGRGAFAVQLLAEGLPSWPAWRDPRVRARAHALLDLATSALGGDDAARSTPPTYRTWKSPRYVLPRRPRVVLGAALQMVARDPDATRPTLARILALMDGLVHGRPLAGVVAALATHPATDPDALVTALEAASSGATKGAYLPLDATGRALLRIAEGARAAELNQQPTAPAHGAVQAWATRIFYSVFRPERACDEDLGFWVASSGEAFADGLYLLVEQLRATRTAVATSGPSAILRTSNREWADRFPGVLATLLMTAVTDAQVAAVSADVWASLLADPHPGLREAAVLRAAALSAPSPLPPEATPAPATSSPRGRAAR